MLCDTVTVCNVINECFATAMPFRNLVLPVQESPNSKIACQKYARAIDEY